jgi:GNAT superfamily N-acetyltransferase
MATPPPRPISPDDLTIVPANQASWADLSAVFGTVDPGRCNCQRYKTRGWFEHSFLCRTCEHFTTQKCQRKECSWAQGTDETRRAALREQTNCDDPEATSTTGLVAYLTEERTPVGWVAVEPRTEYPRLQGLPTVWRGRPEEDKKDDSVWSVTCIVVRKGYRKRGLSYALAAAAIPYAKANGARALEAYAMRTQPGKEITWGELHVGAVQAYADAGFREVSSPSVRRVVMRVDF